MGSFFPGIRTKWDQLYLAGYLLHPSQTTGAPAQVLGLTASSPSIAFRLTKDEKKKTEKSKEYCQADHNNVYCGFINIFRLAIPAFFTFTDFTEFMIGITIFYGSTALFLFTFKMISFAFAFLLTSSDLVIAHFGEDSQEKRELKSFSYLECHCFHNCFIFIGHKRSRSNHRAHVSFDVHLPYRSRPIELLLRDRSLIMGQGRGGGGRRERKLEGYRTKFQRGGGLPKLFCLTRGGLEKNKIVFKSFILLAYPYQRNKHFRISCTHMNLPHLKVICQCNNNNCSDDLAN